VPRGKGKPSTSPSERAALLARERVLEVQRGVDLVRWLRERRGSLTLAQIQRTRRLLAEHAEELYRHANRLERGTAAPRFPRALSLAALARRVEQAGQADDPVTRSTSTRLADLAAALDGRPATPAAIRASAAPRFATRSSTLDDRQLHRTLRRSSHRGAAPAPRCTARMELWRRAGGAHRLAGSTSGHLGASGAAPETRLFVLARPAGRNQGTAKRERGSTNFLNGSAETSSQDAEKLQTKILARRRPS